MGSAICRASGLDRACLERAGLAVDMRHPQSGGWRGRSVRHHLCRTLSAL